MTNPKAKLRQPLRKQPRACGFLIVQGDPIESFLLMQHPKRWDLPKGHIDPGETDLQCALRELQEETGITAEQLSIDENFVYETSYKVNAKQYGLGDGKVQKTLRIFLGRVDQQLEIRLTEHPGYCWFDWNPPHRTQPQAIDPLLNAVAEYLQLSSKKK